MKRGLSGSLYITTTHLMFVADENNKETWVSILNISGVASGGRGGHAPPGENQKKFYIKKHVFESL